MKLKMIASDFRLLNVKEKRKKGHIQLMDMAFSIVL